jgi:hypothetical protein
MAPPIPFCGGCACQAIRYECASLPLFVFQCHCRDCQRATGGPFAVNVWFRVSDIVFSVEPTKFFVKADNGNRVHHYFCRECGSPLGLERAAGPVRSVRAASLDDPSWLVPMANVWTCKAYPWEKLAPDLRNFRTQPREDEWESVFVEQARLFRLRFDSAGK